jgi:hypothetical protein
MMSFESPPYKCLYCLKDAGEVTFANEGHIIPESLGNKDEYVLIGFECDGCNQYFSDLENRFLSNVPSLVERALAGTPNKKGKYPSLSRPGLKVEFREDGPNLDIDPSQIEDRHYKVDKETGLITISIPEASHLRRPYTNILRLMLKMGLGLLLFENLRKRTLANPYHSEFDLSRNFSRKPPSNSEWQLWIGVLKNDSYPKLGQFDDGMFSLEADGSIIFRYKYGFQAFACNLIKPELHNYLKTIEEDIAIESSEVKVVKI